MCGGAVSENEEDLADVVFEAREVSWWSGLEDRNKHKNLRSQETSRVAGFLP